MSDSNLHPEDQRAAFTGLIVGAFVLVIICVGIVTMTNAKFGAHGKPAATTTK